MASDMRLSTTPATILVVADDPRARRTLWTTLSSGGCSVIEAKSSGEALPGAPLPKTEKPYSRPPQHPKLPLSFVRFLLPGAQSSARRSDPGFRDTLDPATPPQGR